MKILQTSHLRGLLKRFSPPSLVGSVSVSFGRRERTDGRTGSVERRKVSKAAIEAKRGIRD